MISIFPLILSSANGRQQKKTSTNIFALLCTSMLLTSMCFSTANGYLLGRLLSLQNVADTHRQLLNAATTGDHETLEQPPLVIVPPTRRSIESEKSWNEPEEQQPLEIGFGANRADLDFLLRDNFPMKKSAGTSYKALKKFSGNGSRNCFFTPIQCMIQHDIGKYKKLVDNNLQISGMA